MTHKNFDVLNVSFYGVYVVITFTASNGCVCQNAYKFTVNTWAHVKGAKNWIKTHSLSQFYGALNKLELAGHCERLDRRERTLRHDVFYYSKGVGGNKRDCYFIKKVGLFA